MNHRKGSNVEATENFGYALGEARDWLDRTEPAVLDILDDVASGKMSVVAARLAISLDFRAGRKNLDDWQTWWAWTADKSGFPYLDESLKQSVLKFPGIRVVLPLPGQEPA